MATQLFVLFLILITPTPAFAYLDPGTGNMLLSMIIAFVATGLYASKNFIFKFRYYIGVLFGKKVKQKNKFGLVFYNEGSQYCSTFYPVLKNLKKLNVEFSYLYSNKDDYIVSEIEGINSHYIGRGNKAFLYLNSLNATMCVMTTPGLDVLQIKRSRGVKHYCHINHSAAGVAGYKVFSLDYFDSVFVQCEHDKVFIKKLESKRKTHKKDIRIIGTPYMDLQLEKIQNIDSKKTGLKTILISPSWGEHGLLAKYGEDILGTILQNCDYEIIVRPHPQSVKYEKSIVENLQTKFEKYSNLVWDLKHDGLESMVKSDCMISDFSGIILDYKFLFEKPVISIPSFKSYDGLDYISKDKQFWYIRLYHDITYTLEKSDITNLHHILDKVLQQQSVKNINEIKKIYSPYFGDSSTKTVKAITDIYNSLDS